MRVALAAFFLLSASACIYDPQPVIVTEVITATSDACTHPAKWVAYTVQNGDTLASIAVRTSSNIATLVNANCLSKTDQLTTGQKLYVPIVPVRMKAITP